EFIGSPSHLCFTLHNVLLGSLRVLANFVTLCNAQCCVIPNKNTPGGLSNALHHHSYANTTLFPGSHLPSVEKSEVRRALMPEELSLNLHFLVKQLCDPDKFLNLFEPSDLRLLRGIPDSWSVGVSVTELVLGRLGNLSFLAGLALVSMTALLQPCIMTKTKCQKIFNKEICSYKVVEQNDPERTCIVL
ncbi:beta-microseminoprotein, partial [Panthera pardus]|uniref:Beta-microseminoprotein n=1 Tax=Panthera pardus TaxID=9691 RepID=A0A9W2W5A9_PANPR